MKHLLQNSRGFTIIEVIIGMGLISTMAFFGMSFIQAQIKDRALLTQQTMYRFLAIQTTQQITVHLGFYPPLAPGVGKALYVGCFDKKANLVANKLNNRDFQFKVVSDFNEAQPTDTCDPLKTAYESRFYWVDPAQYIIMINIVALNPMAPRFKFNNFKIFAK